MKAWFKDLLSAPDGHADELRVSFLAAIIFYGLIWLAWLMTGHLDDWPKEIAAFVGGDAGLVAAFGLGAAGRGKN